MRTIKQIEALVNAGRITEEEAISYIIDFYGDVSDNLEIFPVNEQYCAVDNSGRSQNVNFGDYTCSGDIIDLSYWRENFYRLAKVNEDGVLECRIPHTYLYRFVGGEIVIMDLYDTLTENDL